MTRIWVALVITAIAAAAAAQAPHTHQHGFGGAEHWAKVFDDPARDAWQKPHEVIQALALKPDAVVADIGARTGYFSVRLAHMLPKGRVYAVDTEPDMVKQLAARAKKEGLRNLTVIPASPDNPRLPVRADLILFVDVYHHVEDRARLLPAAARLAAARRARRHHRLGWIRRWAPRGRRGWHPIR